MYAESEPNFDERLPQRCVYVSKRTIESFGKRVVRLRVSAEEILSGDLQGFSVRVVIPSPLVLTLHQL